MGRVLSKDGTAIAYDRLGKGPAVILIDGALCYRGFGPSGSLAQALADHFTVFTYDRRGRGDSGDAETYSVERELEDIEALLQEAGGAAYVWGLSSGAVLALEAALRFPGIRRLALYEAPFVVDGSRPPISPSWEPIRRAVAAGRHSEAVKRFLKEVGLPGVLVAVMRVLPVWSKLKAVAPTLPRDGEIVEEYQRGEPLPSDRWATVTVPTLALAGGRSPGWMRNGMDALAEVVPNGRYRTLEGQTHNVSTKALVPVLNEFFQQEAPAR